MDITNRTVTFESRADGKIGELSHDDLLSRFTGENVPGSLALQSIRHNKTARRMLGGFYNRTISLFSLSVSNPRYLLSVHYSLYHLLPVTNGNASSSSPE